MTRPTRGDGPGRAYLDLQNRARREGRGTQELLTLYVVERWLARLSDSRYAEDFVLKGGMLLAAFGQRRPTVDADTLARNLANEADAVISRVAEIAALPGDDGVDFLTESARGCWSKKIGAHRPTGLVSEGAARNHPQDLTPAGGHSKRF